MKRQNDNIAPGVLTGEVKLDPLQQMLNKETWDQFRKEPPPTRRTEQIIKTMHAIIDQWKERKETYHQALGIGRIDD